MAAVLGATGLFLYLRLGAELDASIRDSLRTRASDVSASIAHAQPGRSLLGNREENPTQILDSAGAIVDSTASVRARPLLGPPQLERALRGTVFVDRQTAGSEEAPTRLLARPVHAGDRDLVVVVSAPLEDRQEA
jgi:hypothetical protein